MYYIFILLKKVIANFLVLQKVSITNAVLDNLPQNLDMDHFLCNFVLSKTSDKLCVNIDKV